MYQLREEYYLANQINQVIDEVIEEVGDKNLYSKNNKKEVFLNIPMAFDIETSSFYQNDEKFGIMYCFVIGIYNRVIFGRTWEEWRSCLDAIVNRFNLGETIGIIYVHNLAYEMQFIRKRLSWDHIFATEERSPIYARSTCGLEFRCSYMLSGMKLDTTAKNLTKYKVNKKVGDLDYSLIRHSDTPMTDKEIGYVVYDALCVLAYIKEQIEMYRYIWNIPLTNTGRVRRFIKNACLYGNDASHRRCKYIMYDYREYMQSLKIKSIEQYAQEKRAYCGGFTHSNPHLTNKKIDNVSSYDFSSSYPSVFCEFYPIDSPKKVKITSESQFRKILRDYCSIFDIELINVSPRYTFENYLSESKCEGEGFITSNGRIIYADRLTTTLTNIDYEIVEKYYNWDEMRIFNVRVYEMGFLPKGIIESVLSFYNKKTSLKGVDGMEEEYMNNKGMLNSIYGCCCTDIVREEVLYDNNEWSTKSIDQKYVKECIESYNNKYDRVLYYVWGVFITAYARRNLFYFITEFGKTNDYIYSDTDSCKITHRDDHLDYINGYNEIVKRKWYKCLDFYGMPHSLITPKTIKGTEKQLGAFEYEGTYKHFKTLGAKKYLYTDEDDTNHLTLAGVSKKNGIEYLEETYTDIYKAFCNDLLFPKEYTDHNGNKKSATGKLLHSYIDYEIDGDVVDYLGNKGHFHEESCVHLEGCDYSLSMADEFVEYMLNLKEVNNG